MSDDIGSGSVIDCLLRSFSDLKGHTKQCRPALRPKSKQTEPEPMSSPSLVTINTLSEKKLIWQPQYTHSEKYGQTYVRSATTQ